MKLMIASDIHGSYYYCRKMVEVYKSEKADKLLLLGDLLYHGPRNDLPKEYNPKCVIALLNGIKKEILCVRGNCDAEVDQMVLEFPILSDYIALFIDNEVFYAAHGHLSDDCSQQPALNKGEILLQGHTHVLKAEIEDGVYKLNPGSVSLPKEGNPNSFIIYENGNFKIKDFDGNILKSLDFNADNSQQIT